MDAGVIVFKSFEGRTDGVDISSHHPMKYDCLGSHINTMLKHHGQTYQLSGSVVSNKLSHGTVFYAIARNMQDAQVLKQASTVSTWT